MIGAIALGKLLVVEVVGIPRLLLLVDLWAWVPASRRLSCFPFLHIVRLLCVILLFFVGER